MTEQVQLALIVALPPTIAACAALVVSILNSRKADTLVAKTDEIHVLANSQLARIQKHLALANRKIEKLHKTATTVALTKK